MTGIVCCCASPDCMLNGCARLREAQKLYEPPFIHLPVGWTCPNCNAGVAPGVDICPQCAPVKITTTSTNTF